jgi:hypothetical protein
LAHLKTGSSRFRFRLIVVMRCFPLPHKRFAELLQLTNKMSNTSTIYFLQPSEEQLLKTIDPKMHQPAQKEQGVPQKVFYLYNTEQNALFNSWEHRRIGRAVNP